MERETKGYGVKEKFSHLLDDLWDFAGSYEASFFICGFSVAVLIVILLKQ